MKNVLLSIVAPALLVTLGFAQTPAPNSSPAQASVKGCLGGSDGSYTVAQDGTAQTFKITSSTVDLKPHLGHDVELIGQTANVAPSSAPADNSVTVTGVNMISDHCAMPTASAPAAADPTPTATASTPAVADPTPVAAASTPVVADPAPVATASTPAVADSAPIAAASTPVVADSAPTPAATAPPQTTEPSLTASARAPESTEPLPATASLLPLFGLAGLSLLGMGFLIRKVRTS
jgi:hypothetical protein